MLKIEYNARNTCSENLGKYQPYINNININLKEKYLYQNMRVTALNNLNFQSCFLILLEICLNLVSNLVYIKCHVE